MKDKIIPLFELTDDQIIIEVELLHQNGESLFFERYFSLFNLHPSNDFVNRVLAIVNKDARYNAIKILFSKYPQILSLYQYNYIYECAFANDVEALKLGMPYIILNLETNYGLIMLTLVAHGISDEVIDVLKDFGITSEKYLQFVSLKYLLDGGNVRSIPTLVRFGGKILMTKDQESILQYLRMHYGESFMITEN